MGLFASIMFHLSGVDRAAAATAWRLFTPKNENGTNAHNGIDTLEWMLGNVSGRLKGYEDAGILNKEEAKRITSEKKKTVGSQMPK